MTDDEILAAIDRRFAEVEGRLPPWTLEPIPIERPLIERTRARRTWGNSLAGVLGVAIVAVAVVALAIAGGPEDDPRAAGNASATLQESTPTSTPTSTSSASAPELEILRGEGEGSELIASRLGWSRCRVGRFASIVVPDLDAIDRAAEAAGIDEGWLQLSESRVLIGSSPERAAVALGASILAYGGNDMWVLVDGRALQLVGFRTPAGRTVWMTTRSMEPTVCPPDVDATLPPAPPTPTIDPAHRSIEVKPEDLRTAWNAAAPGLWINAFTFVETGDSDSFSAELRTWLFVNGQVWPDGSIRDVFVHAEPGIDGPIAAADPRWDETRQAMTALIRAAAPRLTEPDLEGVVAELGISRLRTGEPTHRTVRTHGLAIELFGTGQPDWSLRIQDANDPEP
jgi:hypothetical protein